MKKVRSPISVAVAIAVTLVFGLPQPAMAWDCTYLGGGGGGNWACVSGNDMWFVDCTSGPCIYHRM